MNDIDWKLHKDTQDWVIKELDQSPWIEVYCRGDYDSEKSEMRFIWSFLIQDETIPTELEDYCFNQFDGYPCTARFTHKGGETYYSRFGYDDREPLFFRRSFPSRSRYLEISQEFIHFFQLFWDKENNIYILENEEGNEEEVIRIVNGKQIFIRTLRLKQFLAFKGMSLVIGFVFQRFFDEPIAANVKPSNQKTVRKQMDDYTHFALWHQTGYHGHNFFSELIGKRIINGMPLEKTGIYPFERDPEFESFIIEINSDGNNIECSCDPNQLSNYFGANPGSPHYLTKVFFKKDVLVKYYNHPEKYSVEDGGIRIGSCILHADTNHPDFVIVFLGDLGRDIPFSEQKYWKAYNISPEGKMSDTAFRRSFLGQFADPEAEHFIFINNYQKIQITWNKLTGWDFHRPFNTGDEYRLSSIRLPISESQQEFDQQIENLAVILIDSLNEEAIIGELKKQGASKDEIKGMRGIQKLERYCQMLGFDGYETHIRFLHDLYRLRSTGASHRKDSKDYPKNRRLFSIDEKGHIQSFREILKQANELLEYFIRVFENQSNQETE